MGLGQWNYRPLLSSDLDSLKGRECDIGPTIADPTIRRGSSRGLSVLAAIFRDLLLALMEPLHYRRSPWYQRGLICEALPKVSVILLHDVESRFLGELSMVLGK